MGGVYKATDTQLGRIVAIKVLSDRYADDESIRKRFEREALAAARLSGAASTVTIFDVGECEGRPYIVMEYLDGGTLEDRVRSGGAQDPADVIRWLGQAAEAIDAAHAAGVVHRDVKPGNLLLDRRGDVRVADYGVASAVGLDSMTMTGTVLGTAGYLSPEQARGERATPASDRYALGVVAYELLTGVRPFASDSPTAEAAAHVHAPVPLASSHGAPPEVDAVLVRALSKNPDHRYPSAAAFVAALGDALSRAHETIVAPPVRRGPTPMVWAAAAILGLLAVAGGMAVAGALGDGDQTRTVVQNQTITREGTTVTTGVTTTAPAPPPPPPPASGQSGEELTDEATALLAQGRWAEAEQKARQALQQLAGTGELYEAYANYDLGRALVEQNRCEEALPHLATSERIQGSRREIREARARCRD
jgi:serine/threonine-protein kinase